MKRIGVAVMMIGLGLRLGGLESVAAESPKLPDHVEGVLWWLPEDTQTVVVAQGPFDSERFLDYRQFVSFLGARTEEEEGPLAGRSVKLSVSAGRRFRGAKGLGAWPYEGADIVVYDRPLGKAGDELRKSLLETPFHGFNFVDIKTERIRGHDVVIKPETQWKDTWTTLIVQPRPNVLIYATNRSYLEETLARLERKAKARALPATLPEWKSLDVTSPVWAIRHYDHTDIADDPSSPFAEHGEVIRDDRAIGMVFDFDPKRGRVATVRYLSSHNDALAMAKALWHRPGESLTPTIRAGGMGVVEVQVPINGPAGTRQSHGMFFLLLNLQLGHGVNL